MTSNPLLTFVDRLTASAYMAFILFGLAGLIVRPARYFCGIVLYIASFVIGLDVWFWSFALVHRLWGNIALSIGLLLAGIGVAPMAIVATAIHRSIYFWYLVTNLVILYFCRLAGAAMVEWAERRHERRELRSADMMASTSDEVEYDKARHSDPPI